GDPGEYEVRRAGGASALLNPAQQSLVILGADLQPPASAVSQAAGRLEQEQAPLGSGRKDAPAARLLDNRFKVQVRLVAQQRQLESVLTGCLAVTAAAVATKLGEDRHNIRVEERPNSACIGATLLRRTGECDGHQGQEGSQGATAIPHSVISSS